MVYNEEEDPKSPFNGWLKAYKVAIDLRRWFCQTRGLKSEIQKVQLAGDRRDSAQQAALRTPGHIFVAVLVRPR